MQEKRVHGASRSWRVHGASRSWRGSWPGRTRSLPSSDRLRLRLLGVVIALSDARGHGDMMSRRSSIQQCSSQGEAHEVRRPAANRRTAQQPSTRLLQLGQPLLPSRSQRMRVHGASRSMRVHGASRSMRVHGASRGATRSLAASSASRSSRPRSQASSAPLNKAGAEAEAKRTAVTYNNNSNNNNDDDKIEISVAYGNYWHSENKKNNSNANG